MRKILLMFSVCFGLLLQFCSSNYNDSALWKDIDGIWNDLTKLQQQIEALNEGIGHLSNIVKGGALTGIITDADGNYVITYKDDGNVEQTVTIATAEQMPDVSVLGVIEEDGVYYWTLTSEGETIFLTDTGGNRIPLGGKIPVIVIDNSGYWTINGERILRADGQPVKANSVQGSLFTAIEITEDGNAVFTLGDSSTVTIQVFNALNLVFDIELTTVIDNPDDDLKLSYAITGAQAATAIVKIIKSENLSAIHDSTARTITISFESGFEEGSIMVMVYDGNDNIIIKPLYFALPDNGETGISTAADLIAFAEAVSSGRSVARFRDETGTVVLNNNIDMAGHRLWKPAGAATTGAANNSAVTYSLDNPFEGTFDGKGYSILNINWQFDCSDGNLVYGLFGSLRGATVKNLTIGSPADNSSITISGNSMQGNAVGAFAGYCENSYLVNCKNYAAIIFGGANTANVSVRIGSIAGVSKDSRIGGIGPSDGCANYGNISCGTIVNTANGINNSMSVGGICGYMYSGDGGITNSVNNGDVSAPSGRGGGLVAIASGGTILACINKGMICDDINGIFATETGKYNYKRMGGLVGAATSACTISGCYNNGNVFSSLGCRTGGFVGHNEATITSCVNNGIILSDMELINGAYHGAGWACGYNSSAGVITDCTKGGKVGDYTLYSNMPSSTPAATYKNAVCHGSFSAELNGLTNDLDEYYEWSVLDSRSLHSGVEFKHYSFDNIYKDIYVIEADLSNPSVEIATAISDDIAPNPNGNNNSNNGKNLRETLSEISTRKRAEGYNIVAGVNSGFFDSHNGIPRGVHVEEGEPVFINNPVVRAQLTNHRPGLTFYEDRTLSFETRDFKGLLEIAGEQFEYYSINDTIVRLNSSGHDANLYTHRYVEEPHAGLRNKVGAKALFIIARCDFPLKINTGWAGATITEVRDGRNSVVNAPYVTSEGDWVLQVTGNNAEKLAAMVNTGMTVKIRADLYIGGDASNPVSVHNASMYRFLYNGAFSKPSSSDADTPYPATIAGSDESGSKVIFMCVDGSTSTPTGLNYYELYRVMKKLGCYNAIRFDGGGSTTMWVYHENSGSVANNPCDSKGERSCLNYMHIRIKI